jgi:hypothetical protein
LYFFYYQVLLTQLAIWVNKVCTLIDSPTLCHLAVMIWIVLVYVFLLCCRRQMSPPPHEILLQNVTFLNSTKFKTISLLPIQRHHGDLVKRSWNEFRLKAFNVTETLFYFLLCFNLYFHIMFLCLLSRQKIN